jgi:peptide/nickel transport system substrate-binding protein
VVSGGPYTIRQFQEKGTTIFVPNKYFYGPPSNAAAVTMTYYTNSTSMIADLDGGQLDFVDQVPYNAIDSVKKDKRFKIDSVLSSEVTNVTFNSNPLKPKNRELLNPKVREALEYATDRNQIVKVVYSGYAKPWANMLSAQSTVWLDPSIQPLPFDVAKANQILDSLGYKRGANGIRVVPATTGRYAQAAHPMAYDVIVPDSLDFNGDRQFQVIAADWAQVGVKLSEVNGGDSSQAYALETAGNYTKFDLATWDWAEYIDPDAQLSYMTKGQWFSWSDTGYNSPLFNQEYKEQGTLTSFQQRKALIWKMENQIAADRPYIQLVDEGLVTANSVHWTGFYPDLNAYCKCYYTSPHQT